MLCKEYKKTCTGNSWNLDQRLASGGHWQWLYSDHCWLRGLGCQQVALKVSGGGGNEDKLPLSIKCSQKAPVSNNLWQCALVYIHKMKAACVTDHIECPPQCPKETTFNITPQLVQLIMGRDYSKQHKFKKLFITFL